MTTSVFAPRPLNELRRLQVLREYSLLDTEPEPALDALVQLAAHVFEVSSAVINLLEAERSWIKAGVGVLTAGAELPRDEVPCAWTVLDTSAPTVIVDASLDVRFADGPLVGAGVRFYAGSALVSPEGQALGTLCLMDETPRNPTTQELEVLRVLTEAVVAHLDLHRQAIAAGRIASRLKQLEDEREIELRGLRLLARVQGQFARGDELLTVWNDVCAAAVDICQADGAHIWQAEDDGGLRARASAGIELTGTFIAPEAQTAVRDVLDGGGSIFIEDARENPHAVSSLLHRRGLVSLSLRPICADDAVSAVLSVFWKHRRPPLTPQEENLLDLLGGESAVAIERMLMLGQLRELSQTDALTGAANRRTLTVELRRAIANAKRREAPLCVALLDLDHFKAYNDQHGHMAGDELLKESVVRWRERLRGGDLLARYGGEEFALVLPDCEPEQALALIERLRSATPDDQNLSAGVALFGESERRRQLMERADAALYEAKRSGRGRTEVAAGPGVTRAA